MLRLRPDDLYRRRFVFCSGKGGVGKTSVATALGLLAARGGRRVRVISTDPAHSLGDVLGRRLDHRPARIEPGLEAVELDPDRCMDAYLDEVAQRLRDYVKPALYAEIDRQMAQARHAPGATEAALLEHVAGILTGDDGCDLTVFDTAPTGHALRLVTLPETMAAWTDGLLGQHRKSASLARAFRGLIGSDGPDEPESRRARLAGALERRRQLFAGAREVLLDPDRSALVMVMIPERLALEETARAIDALDRHGIAAAGLVVNQVLPERDEGGFFNARRKVQRVWLDRIAARFDALPRLELPLLETEITRSDGLEELVSLLERGNRR